jgi:hypothetical protein
MALKYVFVFGEDRLPGYADVFQFAHVPLDRIILEQIARYGAPALSGSWSRVREYGEYMRVQVWFRSFFSDSAPLAIEFILWHKAGSLGNEQDLA